MAKFEQILRERFRNILKRSFKNHKNSEIACYPHNQLTFYENDNPQKHGFISQWFNSIENCVQKKGNCSGRSRVRRILLTCIQLLLIRFLDVIWSMPKNFAFFQKPLDKFFYKFDNPEINCQEIFPASFKNIENREGF